MSEPGGKRGFKAYLGTLVATILFPLLWMQALAFARRNAEADPRARAKVLVAIAASVVIAAAGFLAISGFLGGAKAGMYDSMDTRLATAVGESEYQDQISIIGVNEQAIPIVEFNIGNTTDAAKKATLQETLDKLKADLATAQARKAELEDNHAQYLLISAAVKDQDDARIHQLVDGVPAYSDAPGSKFPKSKDLDANVDAAFAIKDDSISDMQRFAWLFLWPSLAGAFFAPLAFAFGNILKQGFEPSDTVGFKPYPGAAAGFFLLFGAFGVPSILFAAWVFNDAFGRSEEGQIAL
jgi:hypothetical protein